jgi:hypothetical protein
MGAFLLHKASKTQEASLLMLALVACSSLNERLTNWRVEGQWQDFEKVCTVGLDFERPKSDIESGESGDE